jgi:hypothetical protein
VSELKKQVIAALLGAIAVALVGALSAFLTKVYHPDAIIKMFDGVTQTQYKLLEDRVAALEGRLPGYENLESRVSSLLSGNTIVKVFNADSPGLLTSNGFSNPVVLAGAKKWSIGGYLTKNDAVRFDRPAKLAVHPYAVFARIRSSNARVPIN